MFELFFSGGKNVGRQAAPSELFRETLVHKTVLTELGWGIRETKTILGLNLNGHWEQSKAATNILKVKGPSTDIAK